IIADLREDVGIDRYPPWRLVRRQKALCRQRGEEKVVDPDDEVRLGRRPIEERGGNLVRIPCEDPFDGDPMLALERLEERPVRLSTEIVVSEHPHHPIVGVPGRWLR